MKDSAFILSQTNWKTIKKQSYDVVVLPWGATEAHNYHLPYGTDNYETEYIAKEAARVSVEKGCRVMILPAIPYGVNTGQLDIPFTINMNPSTQLIVLRDILNSLAKHDIEKFVLMNGHGGNNFKQIIRELQPEYKDLFLCQIEWFRAIPLSQYFEDTGDHAGEAETSIMLKIAPGLVRPLSEAGDGTNKKFVLKAKKEGWMWSPRPWTKITNDTGIGDPKQASAKKGKKYLNAVIKKIAAFFCELADTKTEDLYK